MSKKNMKENVEESTEETQNIGEIIEKALIPLKDKITTIEAKVEKMVIIYATPRKTRDKGTSEEINRQKEELFHCIQRNPGSSREHLMCLTEVPANRWQGLTAVLINKGFIRAEGRKRGTKYYPLIEETPEKTTPENEID
jgi:predicted HTH transcriptional regulator